MDVKSLSQIRSPFAAYKTAPAQAAAFNPIRNRKEEEQVREDLQNMSVDPTSTDTKEIRKYLGNFGELGKFISSISSETDRLVELDKKGKELLNSDQRKALDAEITATRVSIQETINSKNSPLNKLNAIVSSVNDRLSKGESGKDIAASLGQYRSLLGDGFFKLLEKDPTGAVKLLTRGLDALTSLGQDKTSSNSDFTKSLKTVVKDIINALKETSTLGYTEEYNYTQRQSDNQNPPIITSQMSVWA